jgi:hypothetical protein
MENFLKRWLSADDSVATLNFRVKLSLRLLSQRIYFFWFDVLQREGHS